MSNHHRPMNRLFRLFSLFCVVVVSLSSLPIATFAQPPKPAAFPTGNLYRTTVKLRHPTDRSRLDKLQVVIISGGKNSFTLLVDQEQLSKLARLGFAPQETEELGELLNANLQTNSWLAQSLRPLTNLAATAKNQAGLAGLASTATLTELHTAAANLTQEQQNGLAGQASADSDGDGLTDTEESWWCTDPNDSNTRGDSKYTDKDYVDRLKQYLAEPSKGDHRIGQPFQGWPPETSNFSHPDRKFACPDTDGDSVPDGAERLLGLNPDRPSTDLDRYSDGLELLGLTKEGKTMPPTVLEPGNHPMVAAYPVVHVDAVPSSFKVTTVEELYLEQTVTTGTAKTYGTSETRGVSDAVADTQTWNNWQEVSVTTPIGGVAQLGETKLQIAWMPIVTTVGKFILETAAAAAITKVVEEGFNYVKGKIFPPPQKVNDPSDNSTKNVCQPSTCCVTTTCDAPGPKAPSDQQSTESQAPTTNSQDRNPGGAGTTYSYNPSSKTYISQQSYPVVIPVPRQLPTRTVSNGSSQGGAHTTTHTEYQENTVSQSEQFSNETGWTNGTSKNTAHVANLTFSYKISNVGTDYARSLSNLIFNVYIGNEPNPAFTCQMNNPPEGRNCSLVQLENIFPGQIHTYTTGNIWLSLEQMKAIDLGDPIRVVVDSYSMGEDDVFFQNARQGGLSVVMDDGIADGNESNEVYILPTWEGDTLPDVLGRYFPIRRDNQGNLLGISTPEIPTNATLAASNANLAATTTWQELPLRDNAWFNLYLDNLGDGSEQFSDIGVQKNSTIILRYQMDTDYDGYTDRSEIRLKTNPKDPVSHPTPGLVAALNTTASGTQTIGRLAFLNTGNYDAYGVEAIMYAPDKTVSIQDNTIGGGGRVKAESQIVLGSLIKAPSLTNWKNSSAKPYATGSYAGNTDKTFTFTAKAPGAVGGAQALALAWSDGTSNGTLTIPANYKSPLPLDVTQGVKVGFYLGSISTGDSFTVAAELPKDTFKYTVQAGSATKPGIAISYNDPQGNHRFITPVQVSDLGADLAPYAPQMLKPLSLEIATIAPFDPKGSNTFNVLFTLPDPRPITDGKLFINYLKDDGKVVAEQNLTQTFQPGPNLIPVTWNASSFKEPYDPTHDYNILVLVTDWQGNIIQSLARPLSSFQADPAATLAMDNAETTWNFGSVTQGELVAHSFTFANIGMRGMASYLNGPSGLANNQVVPADTFVYPFNLDTSTASLGSYDQTFTLRTSDPKNPSKVIRVMGTIVSGTTPTIRSVAQRPLDLDVTFPGNHALHEWSNFTHVLGPEPQSLHPVKVYSSDMQKLWGVGRYASNFGTGGGSAAVDFGDGRDGDLVVPAGQTTTINTTRVNVSASGSAASPANSTGFAVGDTVLFHQTQATANVGRYEFNQITSINSSTNWTLAKPLAYAYDNTNGRAQVLKVSQYRNVTVQAGGTLTAPAWDGQNGGLLAFFASDTTTVNGTINMSSNGFRGGTGGQMSGDHLAANGMDGEGYPRGSQRLMNNIQSNGNGGGPGDYGPASYPAACNGQDGGGGAGGGGNGTPGGNGGSIAGLPNSGGGGGGVAGNPELTAAVFGGGGGGGGGGGPNPCGNVGFNGGNGGGNIFIFGRTMNVSGVVVSNGDKGHGWEFSQAYDEGSGGSGAGGSILMRAENVSVGTNIVNAVGGEAVSKDLTTTYKPGNLGGNGGTGRIRLEYCNAFTGSTNPPASTAQLTCYMTEQVETTPYTSARVNLPEAFSSGRTYRVQYGRRLVFGAAGELVTTLRVPAGTVSNATFDLLLGGTGSATVKVDIGNNGSWDWERTQTISSATKLSSPNLGVAFSQYWANSGSPLTGDVDVPLKVSLSGPGQVLLTNLDLNASGVDAAITPPDITFSTTDPMETDPVSVTATLHNPGGKATGPLTAAFFAKSVGFGDTYIGSAFVPTIAPNGTAQAKILWDTFGFTGTVPVRVSVDPLKRLQETNEDNNVVSTTLTIRTRPDLFFSSFALSNEEPVVGETVTVTVKLRNSGQATAAAHGVTFYLGYPKLAGEPLGMKSATSLAGGAEETLTFTWIPTTTGAVRLFARADQEGKVNESDEGNNETLWEGFVGFAGPLILDSGGSSDPLYTPSRGYGALDQGQEDFPMQCGGMPHETQRFDFDGKVLYRFDNLQPKHFYHLNIVLAECDGAWRKETVSVDGNALATEDLSKLAFGEARRLSFRLDPALYADRSITVAVEAPGIDGAVVAAISLYDVDYRYSDSGKAAEPQYPSGRLVNLGKGYGWLDGGSNTGQGTLPYQSVRINGTANTLNYRFDGLDPERYYQVNATFWEQTGSSKQKLQIDKADTGLTVDTSSGQPQRVTTNVPLDAYATDRSIVVTIERPGSTNRAFVNEIALEEVTMVDTSIKPVANFGVSPMAGFAPLTVQANDRSRGFVTKRTWDFGDGANDTRSNPSHTYANAGSYTVKLDVVGPAGSSNKTVPEAVKVDVLSPNSTMIRFLPASAGGVGAATDVKVSIANAKDLGAFYFTLTYHPGKVTVESTKIGDFPGSTGRKFIVLSQTIDLKAGTAKFAAISYGSTAGANGTGTLAVIRVQPRVSGIITLGLKDVQVTDVGGNVYTSATQDGNLIVADCLGDFNENGIVDLTDIQRIAALVGEPSKYDPLYDLDGSGVIDDADVTLVKYRWNAKCESSSVASLAVMDLSQPSPFVSLSSLSSGAAFAQLAQTSGPTTTQASGIFRVEPMTRTLSAGQTFTTSLRVDGAVDLNAFDFTLGYSPTQVEALKVEIESFLGSTGRKVVALGPQIKTPAKMGSVSFGAYTLGTSPAGPSGNGKLATVTFRAKAGGMTRLRLLSVHAGDVAGNTQSGQIPVKPAVVSPTLTPTPTPTSSVPLKTPTFEPYGLTPTTDTNGLTPTTISTATPSTVTSTPTIDTSVTPTETSNPTETPTINTDKVYLPLIQK